MVSLRTLLRPRRGGNYAYVTARVRAKRSFLLPPETYPKLLARDVHEIARTLQEGQYKDEIDALAGRFRGAELIERATRMSLGRTYTAVLSWSTGELRDMLALYLGRYDLWNVKTILRGKFARLPPEAVVTELISAGSLPQERLERLARLETMDEVVRDLATTPFGRVLEEHLGAGRPVVSLFEVENALDRAWYASLLAGVPGRTTPLRAFRAFLAREVDVVNLKTVFRLRGEDVPSVEPFFVEGGERVTLDKAQRLLRAKPEEIPAELAELPWWKEIEPGVDAYLKTGSLNPVVTVLERSHLASARDFGYRYPLSVLPVIDFVLRKRIEVDNLRGIAYGKETKLKESAIEELIVA